MSWQVVVRPSAERDMVRTAAWYEEKVPGLGAEFVQEVKVVLLSLKDNPWLNSRRHPAKNVRWRYPKRFPHRVIYEIIESEKTVVVAAVLHAAQHDSRWRRRVG
jgi:plasmid stabilization system protein ParE